MGTVDFDIDITTPIYRIINHVDIVPRLPNPTLVFVEKRDDGASRIERDGQSWFRVAVTAKTIMTSLGPLTYRRARYRSGASGASPVPVARAWASSTIT